ncbi:MAG: hypothetical protein ACYDGN_12060 [Acidimicrobiales bacterium]
MRPFSEMFQIALPGRQPGGTVVTRTATKKSVTPFDTADGSRDCILPVIHTRVPEFVVNIGFVGGLAAAVVTGAVELPIALFVGAGAAIARHRRS